MRSTDYGKKIGQALDAVNKMHSQVSQLLVDCDGLFQDYGSVFGSYATRELTYNVRAESWMADGVYRYWYRTNIPVIAITVIFFRPENKVQREEPLLLVGQIDYIDFDSKHPKEKCKEWDLWWSLTDWGTQPFHLEQIRELNKPDDRIARIVSTAVPLFSIENFADVRQLFSRVGAGTKPSKGIQAGYGE
jgi:hypothetical protein